MPLVEISSGFFVEDQGHNEIQTIIGFTLFTDYWT